MFGLSIFNSVSEKYQKVINVDFHYGKWENARSYLWRHLVLRDKFMVPATEISLVRINQK
jgi:hypothetical protein